MWGYLPLHRAAVEIGQVYAFRRKHGQVTIRQEKHVARVMQNGRHVRRHEVFVFAQPDHHRRPETRGHDFVRIGSRNGRQREHAGDFLDGRAHGLLEIPVEVLLHQVRDDLGIGLRFELVAFRLQSLLQRQVILDDAVVYHYDVAGAVAVRVRVFLGGPPVRGPSGMPDAERAIHGVQPDDFFQIAQFA